MVVKKRRGAMGKNSDAMVEIVSMPKRKKNEKAQKVNELFGRSVAMKRKAAGLDQKDFGEVLGKSFTWVSMIERGKIGISFYDALLITNLLSINFERHLYEINVDEEKSRLAEITKRYEVDLDSDIKEAEERLKALRERKAMAMRVVGRAANI